MNNQELIKWCEALESGEYNQGTHALYTESTDAYCCLGVACRLRGAEPLKLKGQAYPSWADVHLDLGSIETADVDKAYLPLRMDFDDEIRVRELLSFFNDGLRWDFPRIARWIRKHLIKEETDGEAESDQVV